MPPASTFTYPYLMNDTKLRELCLQVREISEETAAFIRSKVGMVGTSEIEFKDRNSLVSYVDKTAEQMLVDRLSVLVENPGFITEEDTVDNNRAEYTWVIDPLDGTTNFLQGIPIFSVSVALSHNGEVILGCVVDVMQHQSFYAWKGGGTWVNGEPVRVSNVGKLSDAIIATGFPYYSPDRLHRLAILFHDILLASRGIRRLGSAALDMTYVACGRMDCFYETDLNAWDVAAGTILVREAGGTVTDFDGQGDFVATRKIIASNSLLHDAVTEILMRNQPVK